MKFCEIRNRLKKNFEQMIEGKTHLFQVGLDKDELYNLYLDSFPSGTNEIFRERREHDCSCCRHFIKSIGGTVVLKGNKVRTIWDFDTEEDTYSSVFKRMDGFVRSHAVSDVYLSEMKRVGTKEDFELMDDGTSYKWTHFYLDLPGRFVKRDIPTILAKHRDAKNVFKRSLEEIDLNAIETVIELSESNTLYKGKEWLDLLRSFKVYKEEFMQLGSDTEKDLYAWEVSVRIPSSLAKIRNTSIGTLLVDISDGKPLDDSVKAYEVITAPSNYKRSKPIFTKRMLEEAQKKIVELGYFDSLSRRFAVSKDVTINDVLFANKDVSKKLKGGGDIFSELSKQVSSTPKKFSNVEEISVDRFLSDVLPNANEVEVYLENRHASNMVSIISPQKGSSKPLFKWGSNYSWSYSGNMTDSMKQRVKDFGGNVDGDLRFSIQWNDCGTDNSDLDAHCLTPNGIEIYYANKKDMTTGGELDVDIIRPENKVAVENITWADKRKLIPGKYKFFVNQFSGSLKEGFKAEIEFDGEIHKFEYPLPVGCDEKIYIAEVVIESDESMSIIPLLNSNSFSKEIWGIKSNEFIPVSMICHSPNYWDSVKNKVGHKHLFFILENCLNPETPSGIFNEFLVGELSEHRKVMEALGNKTNVEPSDEQLSGVGFALDKRDNLIVKVKGAVERVFKVKF